MKRQPILLFKSVKASAIAAVSLGIIVLASCGGTNSVAGHRLISLSLSVGPSGLPLGASRQVQAAGKFSDGAVQDLTNSVKWQTLFPKVLTITDAGMITGVAPGTAVITARYELMTVAASLTVTPAALVSLSVRADNASLPLGESTQVRALGTFTDQTVRDLTTMVTWSSSAPGVVSVSGAGVAQAKALGVANVIASSGQLIASTPVTGASAVLTGLSVTSNNYLLPLGTNAQLTAAGTYSDGSQRDLTGSVTWSSSSPQIVAVNNSGQATANALGSSVVTAMSGNVATSLQLSVSPAQLTSITVSPQGPLVPMGARQQMTATGSYTDGTRYDLTRYVTWSSDKLQVASIDAYGMALATNVGVANLTASYESQNAGSPLTVQPLLATNYFTFPPNAPDTAVRITYPDANTIDLCAMIYVFDQGQQMAECCGCVVSHDGLRTLSVQNDLMSNPLTGIPSRAGNVTVIAADHNSNPSCDASMVSPSGSLGFWSTHLQAGGSSGSYTVQEANAASSPLSDAELASIQAQCSFIEVLGSGHGICSCGSGH